MNLKLIVCFSCLIIAACTATGWKDIRSPLDSPHYENIVERILLKSAELDRAENLRIVNGRPASLGQFPYQVFLDLEDPRGTALCGGSVSLKYCNRGI